MGRTLPSWRIIAQEEVEKLRKFGESLRPGDRAVFEDLLSACILYASAAGSLAWPAKDFPLIISMLFAQHKRIMELESSVLGEKPSTSQPSP